MALAAGAVGSVLGIGGGLFIVPSLTLFLGVKLKTAIATSIVAVIATSLSGGNVYLRHHLADVRLGLLLALATVPAAVIGALLTSRIDPRALAAAFALVLFVSAFEMWRSGRQGDATIHPPPRASSSDEVAALDSKAVTPLALTGQYFDESTGEHIPYRVERIPNGVAGSGLAGLISGLLGVGGGIVQVPLMNLVMNVPLKVAAATSTYLIGITAMAGAFVYYNHRPSLVDPSLAVAASIGVFIGGSVGSNVLGKLKPGILRNIFTLVLAVYTLQMMLRVFGIGSG